MEDEMIIEEVRQLLKYSDIRMALIHKVKELKSMLSSHVDRYMPFIEGEPSEKSDGVDKECEFILKRVHKGVWIPSGPEITKYDRFDYVPPAIVHYIVKYPLKPGVIEMKPGLKLKELPGRTFDLSFEKISSHRIWGTIREHKVIPSEAIFPDPRVDKHTLPPFQDALENAAQSEVIKMLIYYLLRYGSYYRHVASEFCYRWKPLFDCKLINKEGLP